MRRVRSRAITGRGFTFIEVLCVIAILALVASIVVANLDGITAPTRLEGVARQFGGQILQLREAAALRGKTMSLEIDPAKSRWRMVDVPSESEVPDPRSREEETYFGDWSILPETVKLSDIAFSATDVDRGTNITVSFAGDGELSPSGFVAYFVNTDLREDEGISVEVSGLTGLVSYHRGKMQPEETRKPEDF